MVQVSAFDSKDGGWSSRKLHFGVFAVSLIALGWLCGSHWPALQAQYTTFVGGITGVYALFVGANIGSKWVIGSNVAKSAPTSQLASGAGGTAVDDEDS